MFYFGSTFFGQYAPQVAAAPPDPAPALSGGVFYAPPRSHRATVALTQRPQSIAASAQFTPRTHFAAAIGQPPQSLSARARVTPRALTMRSRNARLLALLD